MLFKYPRNRKFITNLTNFYFERNWDDLLSKYLKVKNVKHELSTEFV